MKTYSITFRNGDFRSDNNTRAELINDLRYMRDKWKGIVVVISMFAENREFIKRKVLSL